jgi:hypothetical protein
MQRTVVPIGPLPEGLKRLHERFSRADEKGVAPDLAEGVRMLVKSAWDGTMLTAGRTASIATEKIPLAEAIKRSTAELDASAMAFMASVSAEADAVLGAGVFDSTLLTKDVVLAFDNLKKLAFEKMRTVDYDNIQGALTKHEDRWRSGPHKTEVFVIQQFCLRMVELIESLRHRTGRRFDEIGDSVPPSQPAAAVPDAPTPSTVLSYENSERIVGGRQWPGCIIDSPQWVRLFGYGSTANRGCADPWLTPRMAMRIHHVAFVDGQGLFDDFDQGSSCHPRLPKVARPFFQKSKTWRLAFRDCYARIAMRLQKGLPPKPNCTGEEMAFHNIMYMVPDAVEIELDLLPKYRSDDDIERVKDNVLDDDDLMMLFDANDRGYDSDDEDEPSVDNPILGPGSLASFMLGSGGVMTRAANLHPKDWFIAFRNDEFRNHL